jgi:phosphoribosylformylglycinamidine cyclo-ligase
MGDRYKKSGVDQKLASEFVERIKQLAESTKSPAVLGGLGDFAGFFSLDLSLYRQPVLVAAADGVGTKLKIAFSVGEHRTVGIDLVAMNANDLICHGARPIFFLDYYATSKLDMEVSCAVLEGIAEGCRQCGAALLGGETAQLPGFYSPNEYDLAGFMVGIVEREKIITGENIRPGDSVIGLFSSGLHSNGFSLARKVLLDSGKFKLSDEPKVLARRLSEELLIPTKIYVSPMLSLIDEGLCPEGIAHITGGGFYENIERILPEDCQARIDSAQWQVPAIFKLIAEQGDVDAREMFATFNMGIGMVLVYPPEKTPRVLDRLRELGTDAKLIGSVFPGTRKVEVLGI